MTAYLIEVSNPLHMTGPKTKPNAAIHDDTTTHISKDGARPARTLLLSVPALPVPLLFDPSATEAPSCTPPKQGE